MYSVFGDGAVAESIVRKSFTKFRIGNFDLKDRERSCRTLVVSNVQMETLIKNNLCHTTRGIAGILHIINILRPDLN